MRNKMIPYDLYIAETTTNSVGQDIINWTYIKPINVRIEFNNMSLGTDNIRYKDCNYIGISDNKGLDVKRNYKIEKDGISYTIKSINEFSRYSVYLLERVI